MAAAPWAPLLPAAVDEVPEAVGVVETALPPAIPPAALLLLLTSRYGKSSLLRRGSRWLAYLRVVGGCYIDRCLDGGSWQLWLARRGRADHHHDHGYDDDDDRERPIGITHGKVVVCRYLATTR